MNPFAPVTSAVLFDPGFTYLLWDTGWCGFAAPRRALSPSAATHTSPSPGMITGKLEQPNLSERLEDFPQDRFGTRAHRIGVSRFHKPHQSAG